MGRVGCGCIAAAAAQTAGGAALASFAGLEVSIAADAAADSWAGGSHDSARFSSLALLFP